MNAKGEAKRQAKKKTGGREKAEEKKPEEEPDSLKSEDERPNMTKLWNRKSILALVLLVVMILILNSEVTADLSLARLREHHAYWQLAFQSQPLTSALLFGALYILITGLSLPGATLLTLAAGAVFGIYWGTLIVSVASSLGATVAFLSARFLWRDFVERKFALSLARMRQGLGKDGLLFLFSLRLLPIVPFFVVNLVLGLTRIPMGPFFLVSLVGMLPATVVYVNAGTQLARVQSLRDIMTLEVLLALTLLASLPWVGRIVISALLADRRQRRHKKPQSFAYNVVVVGAGAAGLVAAYLAAAMKAKVALVEKEKMGGDCLNTGCVPSKALLRTAKVVNLLRRAQEFGLEAVRPTLRFGEVMKRVARVVAAIEPHDSVERYRGLGVECIAGEARILSPYEVQVGNKILHTRNIVVASGARPWVPPLPGLLDIKPLTSDTVWQLKDLPKRLVVMGGGPIGCELAQAFVRLGSQVTLVEARECLMFREDADVADHIAQVLQQEGVDVRLRHQAQEVVVSGQGKELRCAWGAQSVLLPFDEILVAVGRKPNVNGLGLRELGVEFAANGSLVTDKYLRVPNFSNIFACGDVTSPYQFTHLASHQAWYAVMNALYRPWLKFKVDHRHIPWCTFTDPEVARVGLSELEAQTQGLAYQVARYDLADLDRAIAEQETHGFIKVLTAKNSDKILGVTIVAAHAGEMIAEFVTAMKHGLGLGQVLRTIHVYPTWSEANKAVAGVWRKQNLPLRLLPWLRKFHEWRR